MTVRYAAGVVAMAVLPLVACGSGDETIRNPAELNPPTVVKEQPNLNEQGQGGVAQENLEGRLGQQVRVTGEVATIISPNAFTIGGEEIGENPILVVGANLPPAWWKGSVCE